MTSRSSFFKLLKADMRQRLWAIVLAGLAFLLPAPIFVAMEITNRSNYDGFAESMGYFFGVDCGWISLITIMGALICAVNGFGYLFSKKKVDFFHSLPVKREVQFAVRYVNGVLIYLIPYLVMLLVCGGMIAFSGHFEKIFLTMALEGFLVHFLGYLTIYTVLILCVTLVGNIVVFFAVSGWVFGIVAIILAMYMFYQEEFFSTYSYQFDLMEHYLKGLRFLSPGYFYVNAVLEVSASLLWQQFFYTVVLAVLALFVYRIRSSEGAGKAIAFSAIIPLIRGSIEFLAGGFLGIIFYLATKNNGGTAWMIFGVFLGVVISHILVESILHFDVRKCFANKLSMAVCGVITVGFVLIMKNDVLGYDTYLPKKQKIASVAIDLYDLDYYREECYYTSKGRKYFSELEEMKLTDIEALYPCLEALIEENEASQANLSEFDENKGYVEVACRLKNGKTVYRRYAYDMDFISQFAPVFESEEYKQSHYKDIYTLQAKDIEHVEATCAMNSVSMNLSLEESKELLATVRKELSAQKWSEKIGELPKAMLSIQVKTKSYDYEGRVMDWFEYYTHEIPVYASYTETLQFLSDRGFDGMRNRIWTGEERMVVRTSGYGSYDGTRMEVLPKHFDRVLELCTWVDFYYYGGMEQSVYDGYWVTLEIPTGGYNDYCIYEFLINKDADLSFLWE